MKIKLLFALILLAAITRLGLHLLPVPPHNFSPISAMGLFGAAYFSRRWMAAIVPFAALFLTDLVLNNIIYSQYFTGFAWITSWWIYAAFGVVLLAGGLILRARVTPGRVLRASLTASVVFFVVSNLSTFVETSLYPHTFAGLLTCYTAALPFFGNTVLGDLVFCTLLFGMYEWMMQRPLQAQKI